MQLGRKDFYQNVVGICLCDFFIMIIRFKEIFILLVVLICVCLVTPQDQELDTAQTNETVIPDKVTPNINITSAIQHEDNSDTNETNVLKQKTIEPNAKELLNNTRKYVTQSRRHNFFENIYKTISDTIIKFINTPKVLGVVRNIGTCVVNGVMEIMSYFIPAPAMPLLASAAGMIIPFEPVVILKQKMPVTSYRRAFNKAVNSFLGTFDKFKVDIDEQDDPYMTRRFNRRMMNDAKSNEKA